MTYEQIEKAAQQHADELRVSHSIPGALVPMLHDIAKSSYTYGAQDALSHQWISVDERLPEAYTDVLIATDKGQIRVSHLKVARSVTWTWPGSFIPKVIAWMPIPALPKLNPEKQSI